MNTRKISLQGNGLPYNPALREFISGKRKWTVPSEDSKRIFRGWHERGYLPHCDKPGLIQMVTFHVRDAFPVNLRAEWAALLNTEDNKERRTRLEMYLDKGRGQAPLRDVRLAEIVETALRYYHGKRYELRAWVLMPNHLHILFKVGDVSLSTIVGDLKQYTALQVNKVLSQKGAFWAGDYWDTYMRTTAQELKALHYIETNPVKAFLVRDPKLWRWSSARFRDEYGVLRL